MKYPKMTISTDFTGELSIQHLCFLAKDITLNRFDKGNYYILPSLEKGNSNTVYFPDLPYSKDFWKAIKSCPSSDLSRVYPKVATDEVRFHLSKFKKNSYQNECEKIAVDWKKIEKSFFSDVEKFLDFGKTLSKVNSINVLITPFGTLGSFNPPRVGNHFNLIATSRVDSSAGKIGAVILQNLYIIQNRIGGEIGSSDYTKRMAVISFIFKNTSFSKYYPNYKDPNGERLNLQPDLLKKSQKYLKKLGFFQKDIDLAKPGVFSPQEEDLLNCLQENSGKVVSFDRVARILWKNESYDKYSPQAMSKVVENIRSKVKSLGIKKEIIFTIRGKGYYLS